MAQKLVDSKEMSVSPDDARAALVELVYVEFDSKGLEMTPPADDGYPREVWTEADRRWYAMSPASARTTAPASNISFGPAPNRPPVCSPASALFDLLCLGLAVGTAYRTASPKVAKGVGATPEDDAEQAPADVPHRGLGEGLRVRRSCSPPSLRPPLPRRRPFPPPQRRNRRPPAWGSSACSARTLRRTPRSILAAEGSLDTPAKPLRITPPPQPGLIDLDFEDGQVAA